MERILIADDHALFRAGLRELVLQEFTVAELFEADSYESALNIVAADSELSLALVDLRMPGMQEFMSLAQLVKAGPSVPFVVLSASTDSEEIRRCFDCGVMGYIAKSEPTSVMSQALRLVLSGGMYVPSSLLKTTAATSPLADGLQRLTPRQMAVLESMAMGRSNKEIARELLMSEATVKAHVTAIFKCLKVSNRTQAVLYVNEHKARSVSNG